MKDLASDVEKHERYKEVALVKEQILQNGCYGQAQPRPDHSRTALAPGPYSGTGGQEVSAIPASASHAALTAAIADLNREVERGMVAAELAVGLATLRDALPAVMPAAADAALARIIQDAEHVRRGRR